MYMAYLKFTWNLLKYITAQHSKSGDEKNLWNVTNEKCKIFFLHV